ncbi:unnamed protein product [marine sediment metagenome]|uniref:Uncharacterized protein n=1 Tax=marine sediment metagenome TaxID=412755 RepID=X0SJI2_9ZZZZ
MIYRVLGRLAVGSQKNRYIEAGSVVNEDRFSSRIRNILIAKGLLSPVSAPPLDAFPGWKLRAVRFTEAGYDAIGILATDDATLVKALGSNVRSIQKWKGELREFLGLGDEPIEFCCDGKRKAVHRKPQPEAEEISEPEEQAATESETKEPLSEPEKQAIEKQEESDGTNK